MACSRVLSVLAFLAFLAAALGLACLSAAAPAAGSVSSTGAIVAREFFAAPDGTPSGNGRIERPWDLQTAFDQPPSVIPPGSTLWLRGGTYLRRGDALISSAYLNFRSALAGRSDAPIMVRPYAGERVTISGGTRNQATVLGIAGAYAWYWDLEVATNDPHRVTARGTSNPDEIGTGGGIAVNGPFVKLIHCVVHDNAVGIALNSGAGGSEAYGCLSYYNGWLGPDRPHGHGFYDQNAGGTPQTVRQCVVFRNFEYGVQAYGEKARLDDMVIEGNTIFDNGGFDSRGFQGGFLIGGGQGASRPVIRDNDFYFPDASGQSLNVGYEERGPGPDGRIPVAREPVVTGNYLGKGHVYVNRGNTAPVYKGNTFYVGSINDQPLDLPANAFRAAFPENKFFSYPKQRPAGNVVHIRPSAYEKGRGSVTVFNWDLSPAVSVDLKPIIELGRPWRVVNAQDFFGREVAGGAAFDGSPVTLPMSGLSQAVPVGFAAPAPSGPEFNVFIVITGPAPASPPISPRRRAP